MSDEVVFDNYSDQVYQNYQKLSAEELSPLLEFYQNLLKLPQKNVSSSTKISILNSLVPNLSRTLQQELFYYGLLGTILISFPIGLSIAHITGTAQEILPQLIIGGVLGGAIGITVCIATTLIVLRKQFSEFKLVLMANGHSWN